MGLLNLGLDSRSQEVAADGTKPVPGTDWKKV